MIIGYPFFIPLQISIWTPDRPMPAEKLIAFKVFVY
jgi:hypothetical protein